MLVLKAKFVVNRIVKFALFHFQVDNAVLGNKYFSFSVFTFCDVTCGHLSERILKLFIIPVSSSVQMFGYRVASLPRLVQLVRRHCAKYVEHLWLSREVEFQLMKCAARLQRSCFSAKLWSRNNSKSQG